MAPAADPSSRRPSVGGRRPHRAARAFYIFLALGCALAVVSFLTADFPGRVSSSAAPLLRRDQLLAAAPAPADMRTADDAADERCAAVNRARDQCAFVRENCPADEGGFTAYLDLYYCRLGHLKPLAFVILVSWLGLLFSTIGIAASDFFCINLSTIAGILGMSESLAGVTFLAFGNGSPDVFSTFAAMRSDSGSLALGELFGAAGFITAVVAGSMALIRPFTVSRKSFVRDVCFFIVAAAFSVAFLWDGKLHLWECVAMVAYYAFYVAFVVVWHWYTSRRRRRRDRDAAMRGHFTEEERDPGADADADADASGDDCDEDVRGPGAAGSLVREDWSALEQGSVDPLADAADEDYEEARDKWMSELAGNMRLTKPSARSRRNTMTPVRPSLVGALEFQAVLTTLQRSRNLPSIPLGSRRFSDDPSYDALPPHDPSSLHAHPAARSGHETHHADEVSPLLEPSHVALASPLSAPLGRARAITASDVVGARPGFQFPKLTPIQSEDDLLDTRDQPTPSTHSLHRLEVPSPSPRPPASSPALMVEPASPCSEASHGDAQAVRGRASTNPARLLAPPDVFEGRSAQDSAGGYAMGPESPSHRPPRLVMPKQGDSPDSSRSTSPFPTYPDYSSPAFTASSRSSGNTRPPSLYLPRPLLLTEPLPAVGTMEYEQPRRRNALLRWWPHRILPPPGIILTTLLPTICDWSEKSLWERLLGVVAAPSVFLLTITLPVVESGPSESGSPDFADDFTSDEIIVHHPRHDAGHAKDQRSVHGASAVSPQPVVPELRFESPESRPHRAPSERPPTRSDDSVSLPAGMGMDPLSTSAHVPPVGPDPTPEAWNRWLTIIQLFLAPIFVVLALFAQAPDDVEASWLVRPILICLLVSVVLMIPLLLTTTPTHRPRAYRILLSLAGFVVSIAWISTVAAQVVGALKALAVILSMSQAIMGLTIFAVGNSLGDLVADVTVAKLGYPVMALSACLGGPMLNILLGVGLSGSYILVRGAERRRDRHPDQGFRFHTFHIEVSKTLIVSGLTLLVTLLALLVLVPCNRWRLDRKIAWALIALWSVSTVFNVAVEATGMFGAAADR